MCLCGGKFNERSLCVFEAGTVIYFYLRHSVDHQKIAKALFIAGCVLCMLQVWLPAYYLTGDGPCHVYNARILHDLWIGKDNSFYFRFYEVSHQPDPNWLSSIVIAALMFVVKGVMAEKVYLTIYVALYVSGFFLLLKKISNNAPYWPLVIFVFVFTHALSKGFYNFSFSIAFYFWVVWAWLRFLDRSTVVKGLLFLLFVALAFFTHLLSFAFSVFTCAALVVSYAIAKEREGERPGIFFLRYAGWLALLVAPFLALMIAFTEKQGGLQLHLGLHKDRIKDLLEFRYIINMDLAEKPYTILAGVVLLILLAISGIVYLRRLRINKYDGFIVSLLLVVFVYFCFPEEFLGRLILISLRVQLFVFIMAVCCISYLLPSAKVRNGAGVALFGCFAALGIIRLACLQRAAEGVADYTSALSYIKPHSVVLPLDFCPNGRDKNGQYIADANWLFSHASEYMGAEKPMIILDNYEANMGYFPLSWKEGVNPYHHLSTGNGIEGQPPGADIAGYKNISGVSIDYILVWCYDEKEGDGAFEKLQAAINAGYHQVYASPLQRTILFEKNK